MKLYQGLYQALAAAGDEVWVNRLPEQLAAAFADSSHGDLKRWQQVVEDLPDLMPSSVDLLESVRVGQAEDISDEMRAGLREQLMQLHPWRKGPYRIFDIDIDTEWRSDWKWDRVKDQIAPLRNRLVLDVGCGNGYHCWRMLGAGARLVVGIDPTLLSVMQFQAIRKLHGEAPIYLLPLGIEDVPPNMGLFDTVFSMGVLYHRRSPIDHLLELRGCLRAGGELILETLVVEGDAQHVLVPEGRYAQMRNVWFLPSCAALMLWMRRCGFKNIRLADVSKTSVEEQRSTEWMRFHSLAEFLDPHSPDLTCEGLPAPVRAVIVASAD
ncbi:tRNA 5-methoxyuridine(34)/uridine 5-oxyacetic acid(34) synthase CmoB [Methylomonas sp. LW13]|uniref:tRNA 5-methoxyuridine(34)/uridine 5-oxyacetic acid(34) synthase CmoB n=1 Tax=unclassified Methylomonas TaxID=2608980 RepID=UPI00051B9FF0|nr:MULTISPECIES: tRNA 5-methoxyuridine(34)/uridine 5-oxyacetic acid(34) synthase CmoB [unclassified Methylomonas]PKD39797.1 tRNA (mo5U34)-methyltransferase [Methylomonas sp. Kb3]QBC29414.1 tRNA 5-methoxyuridine(34)/uridine 5-oxyacetic acid(34) synthase CmoB [Methylomonas sp. LW13]